MEEVRVQSVQKKVHMTQGHWHDERDSWIQSMQEPILQAIFTWDFFYHTFPHLRDPQILRGTTKWQHRYSCNHSSSGQRRRLRWSGHVKMGGTMTIYFRIAMKQPRNQWESKYNSKTRNVKAHIKTNRGNRILGVSRRFIHTVQLLITKCHAFSKGHGRQGQRETTEAAGAVGRWQPCQNKSQLSDGRWWTCIVTCLYEHHSLCLFTIYLYIYIIYIYI